MLAIGLIFLLIITGSVPGNVAIIHYLQERPLGQKTVLDEVIYDFFLCNIASVSIHGASIAWTHFIGFSVENDTLLKCLTWASIYCSLLALSAVIHCLVLRYLFVFRYQDMQSLDERLGLLMIRSTMSLFPTLISLHYYMKEERPGLYHYLLDPTNLEHQSSPVRIIKMKGFQSLFQGFSASRLSKNHLHFISACLSFCIDGTHIP